MLEIYVRILLEDSGMINLHFSFVYVVWVDSSCLLLKYFDLFDYYLILEKWT